MLRLWSLALMLGTVAQAAEPPAASATATTTPPPMASAATPARKPLELRLGDIRNYMTPDEFRRNLGLPDEDMNTVIVQATVPLLPMESEQPIPGGLASLWYAAKKPWQIWRIFAPDLNAKALAPPENKVPPPVFRWGP